MYLYKQRSNYVHDAHSRLTLHNLKAHIPRQTSIEAYKAELPPISQDFQVILSIVNKKTNKMKLIGCLNSEKADIFVRMFNLASAYSTYDQSVTNEKAAGSPSSFGLIPSNEDHKKIQQWISSFSSGQQGAENIVFEKESVAQCTVLLRVLSQYFEKSVTSLSFCQNGMGDYSFLNALFPMLMTFKSLQQIEITGNDLTTSSLETLGRLFQHCQHLQVINLSRNRFGGDQKASGFEDQCMTTFMNKMFTELNRPKELDLSCNNLSDESLRPLIKYVLANHSSKLEKFNIEHNSFTAKGIRTFMKAYSLCPTRENLAFSCGPLPVSFENMRAGCLSSQDRDHIEMLQTAKQYIDITNKQSPIDIVIQRRSNNFFMSGNMVKTTPVLRAFSQQYSQFMSEIDKIVERRADIEVEYLRQFVIQITSQDVPFEIPRHCLEPIFNVINEKLEGATEHENIYIIEVLLDCLKYLNARNIPAEKKYYELAGEAQVIAQELLAVLNMEIREESEMLRLLVKNLRRGKEIGLRGELIDTARHLYLVTEKVLNEMRGQANAASDDEDDAIYDVNEEERPPNVYDPRLDKYVGLTAEQLGLTTDLNAQLAYHPYSCDYTLIANLNPDYVKKNLVSAKRFLKDEEMYSYRNIFERCSVLLSDAGEQSINSITYNLSRNDSNLKLARLIFRYKNNLDKLFQAKKERTDKTKLYLQRFNMEEDTEVHQGLTGSAMHTLLSPAFQAPPNEPIVQKFAQNLDNVIKLNPRDSDNRMKFFVAVQELFETYIILASKPSETSRLKLFQNLNFCDEFYTEIFRRACNFVSVIETMGQSELSNCVVIMALLSNYYVPSSKNLHDAIYKWLRNLQNHQSQLPGLYTRMALQRALTNFAIVLDNDSIEGPDHDIRGEEDEDSFQMKKIATAKSENKFFNNLTEIVWWPPSKLEIEQIITGAPIQVMVSLPNGEQLSRVVDESTTVEDLLLQIRDASYFRFEQEAETYWLFRHFPQPMSVQQSDTLQALESLTEEPPDYPLPKDKKILKLMYQVEKEGESSNTKLSNSIKRLSNPPFLKRTNSQFLLPTDLALQACKLIAKRRIFPSMFLLKNFKKLHEKALDQTYNQMRADYVEKCMLRDSCVPQDIIFFGALILKVKLQGKILRSKQNKISVDLILRNIISAIPCCFLQTNERSDPSGRSRTAKYWATKIEEGFFRRKEFLDMSVEDVKEKFLVGIGLYNVMFSSYFLFQRNSKDTNFNPIYKQTNTQSSRQESSSDFSSEPLSSCDSERQDEDVSDDQDEDDDEWNDDKSDKNQSKDIKKKVQVVKQQKRVAIADSIETGTNFWTYFKSDRFLMTLSLQGIQFLDCSRQDRIVHQIEYEDILYVFGKGTKLKIAFILHMPGTKNPSDVRIELSMNKQAGYKARSVAEDIISYAQLRLLEMSKNSQVEYLSRFHHVVDQKEQDQAHLHNKPFQSKQTLGYEQSEDSMLIEEDKFKKMPTAFPKLQHQAKQVNEFQIDHAELLDEFDLANQSDYINHQRIHTQRVSNIKNVNQSPGDTYAQIIQSQLGNCLRFIVDDKGDRYNFAYYRRNPLLTMPGSQEEDDSRHIMENEEKMHTAESLEPKIQEKELDQQNQVKSTEKGEADQLLQALKNTQVTSHRKNDYTIIQEDVENEESMTSSKHNEEIPASLQAFINFSNGQKQQQAPPMQMKEITSSNSKTETNSLYDGGAAAFSQTTQSLNFSEANKPEKEQKLKISSIQNAEERQRTASIVLGKALASAPPLDDDDW